jgi:hypothetical protein
MNSHIKVILRFTSSNENDFVMVTGFIWKSKHFCHTLKNRCRLLVYSISEQKNMSDYHFFSYLTSTLNNVNKTFLLITFLMSSNLKIVLLKLQVLYREYLFTFWITFDKLEMHWVDFSDIVLWKNFVFWINFWFFFYRRALFLFVTLAQTRGPE